MYAVPAGPWSRTGARRRHGRARRTAPSARRRPGGCRRISCRTLGLRSRMGRRGRRREFVQVLDERVGGGGLEGARQFGDRGPDHGFESRLAGVPEPPGDPLEPTPSAPRQGDGVDERHRRDGGDEDHGERVGPVDVAVPAAGGEQQEDEAEPVRLERDARGGRPPCSATETQRLPNSAITVATMRAVSGVSDQGQTSIVTCGSAKASRAASTTAPPTQPRAGVPTAACRRTAPAPPGAARDRAAGARPGRPRRSPPMRRTRARRG